MTSKVFALEMDAVGGTSSWNTMSNGCLQRLDDQFAFTGPVTLRVLLMADLEVTKYTNAHQRDTTVPVEIEGFGFLPAMARGKKPRYAYQLKGRNLSADTQPDVVGVYSERVRFLLPFDKPRSRA